MKLLLATTNPGKLRELRAILDGLPVEIQSLADLLSVPEAPEDEPTFEGNAIAKALYYARTFGLPTVSDDSGLEVDALDGRPGVHSARYAGPEKDDAANNAKLVAALASVPPDRRTARFRCAAALATPRGLIAVETGSIEGRIVDDARGTNGFGYDPHFYVPALGCTTAELPPELKNRYSHRGQAFSRLRPHIERLAMHGSSMSPAAPA